ncbi:MAG: hypothetical protein WC971_08325 [Coriobacteriia bacterium]
MSRTQSRVRITALVALLALLCSLAAPIAAGANPAQNFKQTTVKLVTSKIGVPLVVVNAKLKDSVKLPVQVALRIPAEPAANLKWVGEMVGAGGTDIVREANTMPGKDYGYVVFQMEKARTAQVEVEAPDLVTVKDGVTTKRLAWKAPSDLDSVVLSVEVPQGAKNPKGIQGLTPSPGVAGSTEYAKAFKNVKAEQEFVLEISYGTPPVPPADGQPGGTDAGGATGGAGGAGAQAPQAGGRSWGLIGTLLAVVVILGVAAWWAYRSGRPATPEAEGSPEETTEAELDFEADAEPPADTDDEQPV